MDLAPKKPLIGLDIGTHAIKAARLQRDPNGYVVDALGYSLIPQPAETNGSLESVVQAIRQTLGKVEGFDHWVVCALNGEQILVRPFTLAPLSPNEIPQAVRLEAMQVTPFGLDNAIVDHQVLDTTDNSKTSAAKDHPIKGVLAVGTHEAVRNKRHLAQQAGARCVLMDIDGLALLNAAMQLPAEERAQIHGEDAVAVINVGHAYTTVAIGAAGIAPFIRDIPFAAGSVTARLSAEMNWSQQQAGATLEEGHTHDADPDHVHGVLDQARAQLADGIGETLRYYAAQQTGRSLHQVRICGGAARMQGLLPFLQQRLPGYAFTLWNPLETLTHTSEVQTDLDFETLGPSFAVALGLALRTL